MGSLKHRDYHFVQKVQSNMTSVRVLVKYAKEEQIIMHKYQVTIRVYSRLRLKGGRLLSITAGIERFSGRENHEKML
jgi:hypothetical protein